MNSKYKWFRLSGLIPISLMAASLVLASCSATPATSTQAPPAVASTQPTTTPPESSVSPTASPGQGFGRGLGAAGTLSSINGNVLIVTTNQGQVTVNAGAAVQVEKTVSGTLSDLQVGEFITVAGSADANGAIAATSIDTLSQGQITQFTPAPGSSPRGGRPAGPNGSNLPNFPGGAGGGVFGTISSINGNTLMVTASQGPVTVNVSSSSAIQETVSGALSDLKVGDSLTVIGSRDSNGDITATSIIVRPEGSLPATAPRNPGARPSPSATSTLPPATSTSTNLTTAPSATPIVAPITTVPPTPTPVASPTPSPSPSSPHSAVASPLLTIVSPGYGVRIPTGDVTAAIVVSNFSVVNKIGQANVPGEGHVIYYLDVTPPTAAGQKAQSAAGTYAETSNTSYTWKNLNSGMHSLSVQLVNNDGTPLNPPVSMTEPVSLQ
jgi:hypothetical protein